MTTLIALVGGGPSALFVYKRLLESGRRDLEVHIFETKRHLGWGMPYSPEGAGPEHITNVSGNELPELVQPLDEWVRALPQNLLDEFGILRESFDEERVLPRLLFGRYLQDQFEQMMQSEKGLSTIVHYESPVSDIRDLPEERKLEVEVAGRERHLFDHVVICSGHNWPRGKEGEVPGYYSSPYPPKKLNKRFNHPVAIRGSSLTAVDALRTLARSNGRLVAEPDGLRYELDQESKDFKVVMHTRSGLLPCIRIHLEEPQVSMQGMLSPDDLREARRANDGFVPLDLMFEEDFKGTLAESDPEMYELIRDMTMEQFVEAAMEGREKTDPFVFFEREYAEARKSLKQRDPIAWKEALAALSFTLNYPAKHFSAEDTMRMQKSLQALIAIVVAFLPHGSVKEILALYQAGCLELLAVGPESEVKPLPEGGVEYDGVEYETYIDCVGQPPLPLEAFPFRSLLEQKVVSQATVRFRDQVRGRSEHEKDSSKVARDAEGRYHLVVPGVAINDSFQTVGADGQPHPRLYLMAVPYMGGHNPDYSGLDFCEEASQRIVDALLEKDG